MDNTPLTLSDIRRYKAEISSLAVKRKVSNVRVFGSVALGTANSESDIDFLVDPAPDCSGFDLGGLYEDLAQLLHCKIDIVTPNAIHRYIREDVLNQAVAL